MRLKSLPSKWVRVRGINERFEIWGRWYFIEVSIRVPEGGWRQGGKSTNHLVILSGFLLAAFVGHPAWQNPCRDGLLKINVPMAPDSRAVRVGWRIGL